MKSAVPMMQCGNHHFGDLWSAQMKRTARSWIKEPVHRHEGLTRVRHNIGRKDTLCRKAIAQAERYEELLVYNVPIWKSPIVMTHRQEGAVKAEDISPCA
jgi:hypothetical protein